MQVQRFIGTPYRCRCCALRNSFATRRNLRLTSARVEVDRNFCLSQNHLRQSTALPDGDGGPDSRLINSASPARDCQLAQEPRSSSLDLFPKISGPDTARHGRSRHPRAQGRCQEQGRTAQERVGNVLLGRRDGLTQLFQRYAHTELCLIGDLYTDL
jgi:hypothetical protein